MKFSSLNIQIIKSVVSNSYTSADIREFIQICHDIAIPLVRKKIYLGKIKLDILGMSENDLVYDCLADLFERDANHSFPQITDFFEREIPDLNTFNDGEILLTLRRLVFAKVNQNFVRIYSEADPILSKILRNVRIAVEKQKLFELEIRFGETYVIPTGVEILRDRPPIPEEFLKEQISKNVSIHDNIPKVLNTIHSILMTQNDYQRCVQLIYIALNIKFIYSLGKLDGEDREYVEMDITHLDITKTSDLVCNELNQEMYRSYVEQGKCSESTFCHYIETVKEILKLTYGDGNGKGETFYEILNQQIPELTKTEYAEKHRTTLEYFVRLGKKKMKEKFNE